MIYFNVDGTTYIPANWHNKYRGRTPYRIGLRDSVNPMAIRIIDQIGAKTAVNSAQLLGISSLVTDGPHNDYIRALTLGGLQGANYLLSS